MTVRVTEIAIITLAFLALPACGSESERNDADTAAAGATEREARAKAIEAKAEEAVDEVEKEMAAELAALQSSDDQAPAAEDVSTAKASAGAEAPEATTKR